MLRPLKMIGLMLVVFLLPSLIFADSTTNRTKALNMLYAAYEKYYMGDQEGGRKGVEAALRIDPNLACGNIVRGEIGMKDQDWPTAQKYYEKGLKLLKQPNQPLSPDPKMNVTVKEVEGDTRCFLGYVYIKQAQRANRYGNEKDEQKFLELADKSLRAGLKLSPGKEARELAEGLLKKFQ